MTDATYTADDAAQDEAAARVPQHRDCLAGGCVACEAEQYGLTYCDECGTVADLAACSRCQERLCGDCMMECPCGDVGGHRAVTS